MTIAALDTAVSNADSACNNCTSIVHCSTRRPDSHSYSATYRDNLGSHAVSKKGKVGRGPGACHCCPPRLPRRAEEKRALINLTGVS